MHVQGGNNYYGIQNFKLEYFYVVYNSGGWTLGCGSPPKQM